MSNMLSLKNVTVKRTKRTILKNITCDIPRGKLIVLVGENGAGKSTLIHTIAGNLKFEGQLHFKTREITEWDDLSLASYRAVMTQQQALNFQLGVPELIAMGRFPIAETQQQKQQRVAEFIDRLALNELANRHTDQLSGGELQRVNIARSFAQLDAFMPQHVQPKQADSKLLLLDEPTSALDLHFQHHLMKLVRTFTQMGNTAIVAIHDLNLASLYADDVMLLSAGELISYGPKDTVLTPELLEPVYRTHMHIQSHPDLHIPMIFSQPKENLNENASIN